MRKAAINYRPLRAFSPNVRTDPVRDCFSGCDGISGSPDMSQAPKPIATGVKNGRMGTKLASADGGCE
jgi:hypothetical protein